MALERLEFASIELGASTIYSTASNASTYIRVRVDYTLNSNTATVVEDVSGYFGSGSIENGYRLRSPSEFSSPVEITNWDAGTKVLTLDGTAAQTAANQLTFITLPAGKIFIESASFAKVGGSTLNPPNSFNDVTGNQSLGLGSYQNIVASVLSQLTSGSAAFPFTGSAEISGSIDMTGSFSTLLNSSENFLIKNALATTQSLFQIDNEGTAIFRARDGGVSDVPTPVVGGLYFSTSSAFIGVDGV
jgi:hypothetical protein